MAILEQKPLQEQPLRQPSTDRENDGNKNWFKKHKAIAYGGAALAATSLTTALVVGGMGEGEGSQEPSDQETSQSNPEQTTRPTNEATSEPSPTDIPEVQPTDPAELVDPNVIPASIVELGTYSLLTPENQAKMKALYSTDIGSFRAHPYEEQVGFGMQIVNNMRPIVDAGLEYDGVELKYTENATTAQEIMDNILYSQFVAAHVITQNSGGAIEYDNELALKLASVTQDPNVANTTGWDETFIQLGTENLWSYGKMYEEFACTVTSEQPRDENGVLSFYCTDRAGTMFVQTKTVTYTDMLDGTTKQIDTVINLERQ